MHKVLLAIGLAVLVPACGEYGADVAARDRCEATAGVGRCVERDGKWLAIGSIDGTTSTTAPPAATTAAPTVPANRLAGVDWSKVASDMDCTGSGVTGLEVGGARYADVRGKGTVDAFVWRNCAHVASSWPYRLEVFDGSSDPEAPRRIAVLVPESERLLIKSLSFQNNTVVVDGSAYAPDDPNCCPTLVVNKAFVWTGTTFVADQTRPTTTRPPYGSPCQKGSHPDCIDPDQDGRYEYLKGGAACMKDFGESSGLCSDLDGDGEAGYPDSG
jgi:hypothetical protein